MAELQLVLEEERKLAKLERPAKAEQRRSMSEAERDAALRELMEEERRIEEEERRRAALARSKKEHSPIAAARATGSDGDGVSVYADTPSPVRDLPRDSREEELRRIEEEERKILELEQSMSRSELNGSVSRPTRGKQSSSGVLTSKGDAINTEMELGNVSSTVQVGAANVSATAAALNQDGDDNSILGKRPHSET